MLEGGFFIYQPDHFTLQKLSEYYVLSHACNSWQNLLQDALSSTMDIKVWTFSLHISDHIVSTCTSLVFFFFSKIFLLLLPMAKQYFIQINQLTLNSRLYRQKEDLGQKKGYFWLFSMLCKNRFIGKQPFKTLITTQSILRKRS